MSRIRPGDAEKPLSNSLMKKVRKLARPKSIEAVTATCPRRLNHPVNQLHTAAFPGGAIWAAQ